MKSNHLQSLSRRVKNALAAIHAEIRFEASSLTGDAEYDKRTYSTLSRLQRERKKLEGLAVALKKELKSVCVVEGVAHTLRKHHKKPVKMILIADVDGADEL